MKKTDFKNFLDDNDLKFVLEKVGKGIVDNAIKRLKEQSTWNGTGQLDKNSTWTLYYKASKGYDLRTGIMKDRSLINRDSYSITISGSTLKFQMILNVVGEALEKIQTLAFWGEERSKNYMSWWVIDNWQSIVDEIVFELTKIIVGKLEGRFN